jgi:hypothetical protein
MEAVMEDDDYWAHQRPGLRKTVCAWAIFVALALILAAAELVWPSQPAPLNTVSADAGNTGARARRAFDREEREDIEPVQDTEETGLDPRQIALER